MTALYLIVGFGGVIRPCQRTPWRGALTAASRPPAGFDYYGTAGAARIPRRAHRASGPARRGERRHRAGTGAP